MTACTYRGCPTPATTRLEPPNPAPDWYGCDEHAPAMAKAFSFGCASDLGATVHPHPPAPAHV